MSCNFCLGFCATSKVPRAQTSIFDGEDTALEQARERASQMPEDIAATNLRMFFCLEIGQLFIRRKCEQIADTCGLEGTVTPAWLRTPVQFTHRGLTELIAHVVDMDELFVALDLEMKMRKEGGVGATTADLFSSGLMTVPLRDSVTRFHRYVQKLDASVRRSQYRTPTALHYPLGGMFAEFLITMGAMPQDYVTILTIMFNITSTETVSPWSTKIPFL
jgi:hypothetical protein